MDRLSYFLERLDQNRFWWFLEAKYLPSIFADLSDEEWEIMHEWFETYTMGAGECNVPAMSLLLGLISGNNIDSIVQTGHHLGYSTLLMAWTLRRMGKTHALYSVDIDMSSTIATQYWIDKAGLGDIVKLVTSDSAVPQLTKHAVSYFGTTPSPKLIFIDSSHQYKHTLKEVRIWHEALAPQGLMVFHDVSVYAELWDTTGRGGVHKAMKFMRLPNTILINENVVANERPFVYKDGCGLGIVQK